MGRIILGSGNVYIDEFDGVNVPSVDTLKKDENLFAKIKNGASLEYTAEYYKAFSDDGTVKKTRLTTENLLLKLGLCTVDENVLKHTIPTVRTSASDGKTVIKIGGVKNDNGKSYALLFYSEDKQDGDVAVMIVGKNTAGATFSFKNDGETILEPTFEAESHDKDGTLAIIELYEPTAATTVSEE